MDANYVSFGAAGVQYTKCSHCVYPQLDSVDIENALHARRSAS